MGKIARLVWYSVVGIVVVFALAVTFTVGWRPFLGPRTRPATSRTFERTPERLARGRYIFVTHACIDCHAGSDNPQISAPIATGTPASGEVLPFPGLPGRIVASNLTADAETGLGRWSDDEIARAIREGVSRDDRALFPMMPYRNYRSMSDEDVEALVVYLRSLPAVRHPLEPTQVAFPVKYLINSAPEPLTEPVRGPDPQDALAVGKYLVTTVACDACHTPQVKGEAVPGMNYAGGVSFTEGQMRAASANITPDASGIGYYDEALFLQAMRTGQVRARKLDPLMPYQAFSNFRGSDLKAMFAYLRTLPPVRHRVDNSLPVTYCKLCRQQHGAGDQN
ncbi:MAG: c-type cytochrome [Acidobacteriales bacterium]|nr:c-type cytochrome [Terriglobales bacterium]